MSKPITMKMKLLLSNLCYTIPIGVLLVLVVSVQNENIKNAELERSGNVYQAPLQSLLQHFGEHSWLNQRAVHGDDSSKSALAGVETKIDEDIQLIEKLNLKYAEELQFTEQGLAQRQRQHFKIETLKSEWDDLKKSELGLKSDVSVEKHAHLISDVRTMITHIGDTSGIILDPDLDSYYLGDITLGALPQMQERLVDIIVHTEVMVRRKVISKDDRSFLAVAAAFLKQSDLDRMVGDAQTAVNEDKNFNGVSETLQAKLPIETAHMKASVEALLKIIDTLLASDTVTLTPEQFIVPAQEAFLKSFSHWSILSGEFDQLLKMRISNQSKQKNKNILSSLFALALCLVLAYFIGRSLSVSLRSIAGRVGASTAHVKSTSDNLATTSKQMASSSQQQAASVEEASASLEEITAMLASTVKSSQDAFSLSETVAHLVSSGSESMNRLEAAVAEISESNQRVENLTKLIDEIGEKTELIDEIVFQTRLLSFNASVEAERAGEHGRGFAVVAQEVGSLALMSGKSATEIGQIVKNSINEAREVAQLNRKKVEQAAQLCKETATKLSSIQSASKEILGGSQQILRASKEQSAGIQQINQSIQLINQSVQENASSSEDCASNSQALLDQGASLQNSVFDLQLLVSGKVEKSVVSEEGSPSQASFAKEQPKVIAFKAPTVNSKEPSTLVQSQDAWEKI